MIQLIITLTIVTLATIFAAYRIIKHFVMLSKNQSVCDSCASDCKSCSVIKEFPNIKV